MARILRPLTRVLPGVVLLLAGAHAQAQGVGASPAAPAIEDTRAALERWVEVRQTIAKEKNDWALGREVMADRIELMKRSIAEVRQQIEAQREKLAGFETGIEELEARNEKLKEASAQLEGLVASMESRTVALLAGAPAPLVEQVKPLAAQMPGYGAADSSAGDPAGSEVQASDQPRVPLSRRVENVVGVLYLFNKFAGKIEQANEMVQRPDGTRMSVDTVFLGLSYGFYVDDADTTAANGYPGPDGWVWNPVNAAASRVRQAIRVFNSEQPAAFVGLPVEVK